MQTFSKATAVLLVLLFTLVSPITLAAASYEFSVTAKTAFDKMKAAADKGTSAKLVSYYTELQTSQKQTIEWDLRIDKLHYQNEETELATRKRIREVDAEKLIRLEAVVVQTKKKYEPLFHLYDTLNQQLNIAKSFKDKILTNVLKPQVETTKAAVSLAKLDIRNKETTLKAAKANTAKTIKDLRELLSGIDPLKVKIKASKSAISSIKKQFMTETAILNQVVKKGDSSATLSSFIRMLAHTKQINEQKQKTYAYEEQTKVLIAKVDAKIAVMK